jgi:formiminotetrahydrofolate cyclodeaminase
MSTPPDYLNLRLRDLLERIAEQTPAPGGGSVAAFVVAMAAGLVAMAARFSREHWAEAAGALAQAERLRRRAEPLGKEDAEAYEEALRALRLPREADSEGRNEVLRKALERAAAVPLEIAGIASSVALLAAEVAERGNPNLRGDAAAAAVLAEGGARAAANLVAINLGATEDDPRVVSARALVESASSAARRALAPAS